MEPIRVLEVIRQGQIGGGESHVLDLVQGFSPEEVKPVIMAFTPGHMIDVLRERGFACHVVETGRAFDPRVQRQIGDVIRSERIQIVHAHGSRAASNVLLPARRHRLPLVYTVHGWSFHQDQLAWMRLLRAKSEQLICRCCSRVICVSESNRQSGREAFGLKEAAVIENGIDLERFNPDRHLDDVRGELGLAKSDLVVGLIARMTLQKAPMDFVKAIVLAHRQNPRIKGLLVGDGDMKEQVHEYIRREGLGECFCLSGFRTDMPELLRAVDIYCLPSLWEGLSIALLEAMAMRKPVVVTPTDGTKEIIRADENGLIVDFGRPEALAGAFLRYARQPEMRSRFGEAARQLVRKRFDSRRVSREVTACYKELL